MALNKLADPASKALVAGGRQIKPVISADVDEARFRVKRVYKECHFPGNSESLGIISKVEAKDMQRQRSPRLLKKPSKQEGSKAGKQKRSSSRKKASRYQQKAELLIVDNADLLQRLRALTRENSHIVEYVYNLIQDSNQKAQELTEKIELLLATNEFDRKEFAETVQTLKNDFATDLAKIKSENSILKLKCACLDEFQVERDQLVEEIGELELKLAEKHDEEEEQLIEATRNAILDKAKLKQEMATRIEELTEAFKSMVDAQLNAEHKKLILEKHTLEAKVETLSSNVTALYAENMQLKDQLKVEQTDASELRKSHAKIYSAYVVHQKCASTANQLKGESEKLRLCLAEERFQSEKERCTHAERVKVLTDELAVKDTKIMHLASSLEKLQKNSVEQIELKKLRQTCSMLNDLRKFVFSAASVSEKASEIGPDSVQDSSAMMLCVLKQLAYILSRADETNSAAVNNCSLTNAANEEASSLAAIVQPSCEKDTLRPIEENQFLVPQVKSKPTQPTLPSEAERKFFNGPSELLREKGAGFV